MLFSLLLSIATWSLLCSYLPQDLVNGLNAATAPGTYAFREVLGRNNNGVVGTDVISGAHAHTEQLIAGG